MAPSLRHGPSPLRNAWNAADEAPYSNDGPPVGSYIILRIDGTLHVRFYPHANEDRDNSSWPSSPDRTASPEPDATDNEESAAQIPNFMSNDEAMYDSDDENSGATAAQPIAELYVDFSLRKLVIVVSPASIELSLYNDACKCIQMLGSPALRSQVYQAENNTMTYTKLKQHAVQMRFDFYGSGMTLSELTFINEGNDESEFGKRCKSIESTLSELKIKRREIKQRKMKRDDTKLLKDALRQNHQKAQEAQELRKLIDYITDRMKNGFRTAEPELSEVSHSDVLCYYYLSQKIPEFPYTSMWEYMLLKKCKFPDVTELILPYCALKPGSGVDDITAEIGKQFDLRKIFPDLKQITFRYDSDKEKCEACNGIYLCHESRKNLVNSMIRLEYHTDTPCEKQTIVGFEKWYEENIKALIKAIRHACDALDDYSVHYPDHLCSSIPRKRHHSV